MSILSKRGLRAEGCNVVKELSKQADTYVRETLGYSSKDEPDAVANPLDRVRTSPACATESGRLQQAAEPAGGRICCVRTAEESLPVGTLCIRGRARAAIERGVLGSMTSAQECGVNSRVAIGAKPG